MKNNNNLKKVGKKSVGNPEKNRRETRLLAPKVQHYQHFVQLLRKKRGNALPVVKFRSKGLTMADIA